MKLKLLFTFFFISTCVFAQSEVYLFKDTTGKLSLEEVIKKPFQLQEENVLEPYSESVYWFKIPKDTTDGKYSFKLLYNRIYSSSAYKNDKELNKLKNKRFITYEFTREYDVYVKVSPTLHSFIPFELKTVEESNAKETKELLLNGFYYGFAFLVIIYNLCYFLLFKDEAFLYYALFLGSILFSIYMMDGMLVFYKVSEKTDQFLMILAYYCISYFSSKFASNYLFIDNYYPKLKYFSYSIGTIIILLGILYLSNKNFYFLITLNILLFLLLTIYWFCSVFLFKSSVYVRILTLAYVIILFSGIDYYVLKYLGVSILNTNNTSIKIGAFIEMVILSVAVLYRMKTLRDDNHEMRLEIIDYSSRIKNLENTQKEKNNINKLSIREKEVFDLIIIGKSNKEISDELNISVNTVKFHLKNVYEKLNIKNRKEALNY